MKKCLSFMSGMGLLLVAATSQATLVSITDCGGTNFVACEITTTPPNPVTKDPNDGKLLAWNEKQNVTLVDKLYVDRVFDTTASFVGSDSGGLYLKAGTIVSSHYVQWDPSSGSGSVQATINADSDILAFIYADNKLFSTDTLLGLDSLDYNNFAFRGLETSDKISFNGGSVDIDWFATSPGDWTRLITAYSPAGARTTGVPVPAPFWLMLPAFLGLLGKYRRH